MQLNLRKLLILSIKIQFLTYHALFVTDTTDSINCATVGYIFLFLKYQTLLLYTEDKKEHFYVK